MLDLGWVLNCPFKKRKEHRDRGKKEAETKVMWPQAKECQEPPEAGGGKEGFSPRDFGGSKTLLTA